MKKGVGVAADLQGGGVALLICLVYINKQQCSRLYLKVLLYILLLEPTMVDAEG